MDCEDQKEFELFNKITGLWDDEKEFELFTKVEELKFPELEKLEAETEALMLNLEAVSAKYYETQPSGYADAGKIISGIFAAVFNPDRKTGEEDLVQLMRPAQVDITISVNQLHLLIGAAHRNLKFEVANKYVEDERKKTPPSRNIWATCAEILGLKKVNANLSTYDEEDECIEYVAGYDMFNNAEEAAKHVFKKYKRKHNSFYACKKWLKEHVGKRRNEADQLRDLGIGSIYSGIPLPSTNDD
jgi:hypothetical protein